MTIDNFNCPRCKLPQIKTHQCKYCGLIYEEHARSRRRWVWLLAAVLMAAGAVVASYRLLPSVPVPGKPAIAQNPNSRPAGTTDENLKTTADELSGDAGLIGKMTGGLTKGSVIAMVFFSIVGIGYMTYGKKSQQLLMVVCGIALMLYSYFVADTVYIVLIGVGLSALPFLFGFLAAKPN